MKSIHILLVEDNEGDILLTTEALEESNITNKISVVKDGNKAIEFLNKTGMCPDAELPDLILLDINLPRKNGYEVLQYVKKSEKLKQIPVLMLTTSSSKKDIIHCYEHFANGYISKPVEVDDFLTIIQQIKSFWLNFKTGSTEKSMYAKR